MSAKDLHPEGKGIWSASGHRFDCDESCEELWINKNVIFATAAEAHQ